MTQTTAPTFFVVLDGKTAADRTWTDGHRYADRDAAIKACDAWNEVAVQRGGRRSYHVERVELPAQVTHPPRRLPRALTGDYSAAALAALDELRVAMEAEAQETPDEH